MSTRDINVVDPSKEEESPARGSTIDPKTREANSGILILRNTTHKAFSDFAVPHRRAARAAWYFKFVVRGRR